MMRNSYQVLDGQLGALEETVEADRWKGDHADAMLCLEIEDFIALALGVYERIEKHATHWNERLREPTFEFAEEDSRELSRRFTWWGTICGRAMTIVEHCEAEGHDVAGADALRKALREASIPAHFDEIQAASRRFNAGRGRYLDE